MSVCKKNHVDLWEKSCRFVGKIMSVLWEKSSRFVGKIRWTQKVTGKYPQIHWKKIPDYLRLFADRVSQRLFDGKFVET